MHNKLAKDVIKTHNVGDLPSSVGLHDLTTPLTHFVTEAHYNSERLDKQFPLQTKPSMSACN